MKSYRRIALDFLERNEETLLNTAVIPFWLAIGALFLEKKFPALKSFAIWTFKVYLGIFVAGLIGLLVIAPAVLVTRELESSVIDSSASRLERNLTRIWCVGAGSIFAALVGAGYMLQAKVWVVALCFVVFMVPYAAVGYLVRRVLSSYRKRNA